MHPSDVLAALLGVTLVALVLQRAEAASAFPPEVKTYTEKEAKKFLKNLNLEWAKKTNTYYLAKWDYETDISKKTLGQEVLKVAFEVAKFQKQQRKEAVKYPRDKFTDRDIRRQLLMYSKLGAPGLPDDKYVAYQNAEAELGSARRCNHIFQCEHKEGLDPEAENQHRLNCWMQFRYGKNASDTYASLMDLSRQAATLDNYTDYTEYLLRNFEDKDIVGRMNVMASHLDAFYKQMTVYCRQRLRNRYGNKAAPNGLPIPAHLIDDPICRTDPVPRKPLDFPGALRAKGFTVRKLFGLPDEFFRSLNMTGVPDAVWEKSILELGVNKTMSCRAVAQDFLDNKDYRIRVCGKVSDETFFTASRLVTGIVYAMEMRQQPSIYRQTMSDAFVEGIGNMVALSLLSPNFLRYQGLLAGDDSAEMDANLLYMIARHTLIPAIRSHTLDRWRFLTLTGETQPRDYNCKWWRMRQSLEGLEQPLDRSARDFDAANPDMILNPEGTLFKTIFATALGFQMHRQLCTVVGLFDPEDPSRLPLHRCNLLNQPLVSEVLKKMMQAGASKSWKDVMEQAIGTREIDHRALLTYFEPLEKFLEEHNARTGEVVGWAVPNRQCHLTRKQLRVMDPEQAKKGYYSCPMGENEEDEEEETTLAPTTTTTPAPSTTAPTAASTAPPDEASITPTVDTAATATATEAA